jgi:hypothetical protein
MRPAPAPPGPVTSTGAPRGATLDRGGPVNNRRILGWIAFVGVIILLNVLSQVFDWGWQFY